MTNCLQNKNKAEIHKMNFGSHWIHPFNSNDKANYWIRPYEVLASVRLEMVERRVRFDTLSTNGSNINNVKKCRDKLIFYRVGQQRKRTI
jgi:hypothetical protein